MRIDMPVDRAKKELRYLAGKEDAHPEVKEAWRRQLKGFIRFCEKYCWIKDEATGTPVKAVLWDDQKKIAESLFRKKRPRILKTRQNGITTVIVLYCDYMMTFGRLWSGVVFNQQKEYAEAFLLKMDFTMGYLPTHIGPFVLKPVCDARNQKKRIYDQTGRNNSMTAMAATEKAAKSGTYNFALFDEAQDIKELQAAKDAIRPALDTTDGIDCVIGTGEKGPEVYFKTLYDLAKMKVNPNEESFFFPWWSRPGRTQEWYESERDLHRHDIYYMFRAYPASEEEAWTSSSGRVLPFWSNEKHVKTIEELGYKEIDPIWRKFRCLDFGGIDPFVCLWATMVPSPKYGIAFDPSCVNAVRQIKGWQFKKNGVPDERINTDCPDAIRYLLKYLMPHGWAERDVWSGVLFFYRELFIPTPSQNGVSLQGFASEIVRLSKNEVYEASVADPSASTAITLLSQAGAECEGASRSPGDTRQGLIKEGCDVLNSVMEAKYELFSKPPVSDKGEEYLRRLEVLRRNGVALGLEDKNRLYLKEVAESQTIRYVR